MHSMERPIDVATHQEGAAAWELASASPCPALAPYVLRYQGYRETGSVPVVRRELPGARVVLIIKLGPPLRVAEPGQKAG